MNTSENCIHVSAVHLNLYVVCPYENAAYGSNSPVCSLFISKFMLHVNDKVSEK